MKKKSDLFLKSSIINNMQINHIKKKFNDN